MMFPAGCLWTLLTLSISIMGSPVEVRNSRITLPMTTRLHFSNDTNPVQRDDIDVPLENVHMVSWASIGVGGNPTFYRLVVNTGSAITWIGAVVDTVSRPTGILLTDTLWITTPNARYTIDEMPIGVTVPSTWGMPYDGMLGIGPQILSRGTIIMHPDRTFRTVTERLFAQGSISLPLVGLFFKPSTEVLDDDNGMLVFGDENPDINIGIIRYTRLSRKLSVSDYWGIDQAIRYGNEVILPFTAGIVDSGTTFIWIAPDAYDRYQTATGANLDPNGMLSITLEQYHALQPLAFHIDGEIYNLSRNGQIWPRWLNHRIDGAPNGIYLVIKSLNRPAGTGINFRLGYVFLQRFYSVYDDHNFRIGFATTPYTDADTN
ncbi:aspartic peptidase A1 [Suillus spraguei]|nr:aspartic peptidase A1 [Suillus spraguei]